MVEIPFTNGSSKPPRVPRVLTIAGSDSSGGAGIEADLKTITVHGCYGLTCITALTAQNTTGVRSIHATPAEFVADMLDMDFIDVDVDAVKTGMLASRDTILTISQKLREYGARNICVDPVMISTSGAQLLPDSAVDAYISELFPLALIITPNLQEAQFLYSVANGGKSFAVDSLDDAKALAVALHALGPKCVLLKGGHLPLLPTYRRATDAQAAAAQEKQIVADVLYDGAEFTIVESPFLVTKNTHGTGCTLSCMFELNCIGIYSIDNITAAIASNLAKGRQVPAAVREAIAYVHGAIAHGVEIGHGNGPINHIHRTYIQPAEWLGGHT
ncbi:Phosphomethylpyrimidine kinase-domain-containing protein [Limtongia smithiae]|uniref:Phosphomethylpyrimidine kinase-domain-containing protein n=1 Tax=Limtongia smithiae TaxID=1125753 RepID=UPI0034CD8FED